MERQKSYIVLRSATLHNLVNSWTFVYVNVLEIINSDKL